MCPQLAETVLLGKRTNQVMTVTKNYRWWVEHLIVCYNCRTCLAMQAGLCMAMFVLHNMMLAKSHEITPVMQLLLLY